MWDKKVRRELGDEDDETNQFMSHLQESNWNAVAFLNRRGYEGKHLQATIIKARKETPVTVAHSKERMILLAKAKTHGEKFTVIGDGHLTSHDFFKSMEVPMREKEIAEKVKEKEMRLSIEMQQNEA